MPPRASGGADRTRRALPSTRGSLLYCRALAAPPHAMPVDHYENFPVASLLMPRRLRRPVEAIYRFARQADDLADEGDATPAERRAGARRLRRAAVAIAAGERRSPSRPDRCSSALAAEIRAHRSADRPLSRPAVGVLAGLRRDALRRRRAAARLLPPLGESGRATAAACCTAPTPSAIAHGPTASARRCSGSTSGRTSASTAQKDRIYLPRADLARFGVDRGDADRATCRAVAHAALAGADAARGRSHARHDARRRAARARRCPVASASSCA